MSEEPSEIGGFGYGIRVLRHSDGRVEYQIHSVNKNVPTEIVIMQMEVFLNDLKREYSEKHGKKSSKEGNE